MNVTITITVPVADTTGTASLSTAAATSLELAGGGGETPGPPEVGPADFSASTAAEGLIDTTYSPPGTAPASQIAESQASVVEALPEPPTLEELGIAHTAEAVTEAAPPTLPEIYGVPSPDDDLPPTELASLPTVIELDEPPPELVDLTEAGGVPEVSPEELPPPIEDLEQPPARRKRSHPGADKPST